LLTTTASDKYGGRQQEQRAGELVGVEHVCGHFVRADQCGAQLSLPQGFPSFDVMVKRLRPSATGPLIRSQHWWFVSIHHFGDIVGARRRVVMMDA
jgi:hypothetical protein